MNILELICAPSNYKPNRPAGMRPEAVVPHRSGGAADQIGARFLDAASAMSSHYMAQRPVSYNSALTSRTPPSMPESWSTRIGSC